MGYAVWVDDDLGCRCGWLNWCAWYVHYSLHPAKSGVDAIPTVASFLSYHPGSKKRPRDQGVALEGCQPISTVYPLCYSTQPRPTRPPYSLPHRTSILDLTNHNHSTSQNVFSLGNLVPR